MIIVVRMFAVASIVLAFSLGAAVIARAIEANALPQAAQQAGQIFRVVDDDKDHLALALHASIAGNQAGRKEQALLLSEAVNAKHLAI